jgi:hypothetical protein
VFEAGVINLCDRDIATATVKAKKLIEASTLGMFIY